ncbi:hypothetical protein RDI58_014406 [Solanum bulbocastanum]|uniref:Anti-PCD protein n=1 Tax=Solanum bulbocastanum TaxID=147425 RepID=A0AAN8TI40_SOLBU
MEASKNLIAMFFVCIIVISSSMADEENKVEEFKKSFEIVANEYKDCYNDCQKECTNEGFGYTRCEMKCDSECSAKLLKERIEKMKN